jgi:hypothetical protein
MQRNLQEEQAAGERLSRGQGAPFAGKNFADPNVKKSYFEAINQEVYGIPNPSFGTSVTPSSATSSISSGQQQQSVQQATPTLKQQVQTTQAESDEAYRAYQEAREKFTGMKTGATGFEEAQKTQYEKAMPEITAYNKEEATKYEELGNIRNELEAEYDKAGIVDWRTKQSLIEKRMNEVRKDIQSVQSLKQQRGLTISDLVSKAVSAYGLSIEAAQSAAEMAQEDYQTAFDKYAQALSQRENEKSTALELAFQPSTLQSGVAPGSFMESYPEYAKTWEAQSTEARRQQAFSEQQASSSGSGGLTSYQLYQLQLQQDELNKEARAQEATLAGGEEFLRAEESGYYRLPSSDGGWNFYKLPDNMSIDDPRNGTPIRVEEYVQATGITKDRALSQPGLTPYQSVQSQNQSTNRDA